MSLLKRLISSFSSDKKPGKAAFDLKVDIHSHLLPGIDDGVKTLEESVSLIKKIAAFGVEKIITTPHIMYEFYRNTPGIIHEKLKQVREALKKEQVDVVLEAAAEYYLDDHFIRMVESQEPLLTFGDRMVLVETNYIQSHPRLKEVFFNLRIQGYQPVFAHPERYMYLQMQKNDYRQYEDLYNYGVLFQVNMMSFTGYYGPQIKKVADHLLKEKMIHMIGSDIHKGEHVHIINQLKQRRLFEKIMALDLMNNALR
jgi:protein-tyrosine phosphatase